MHNPQSSRRIHFLNERGVMPWQADESTLLAERLHDLARALAASVPRGEHRLKDNLMRSTSQLLKQLALATCEPSGSRYLTTLQAAVRAATDASLWIRQCIRLHIGRPTNARAAWDLVLRIQVRLEALELEELRPFVQRDRVPVSATPSPASSNTITPSPASSSTTCDDGPIPPTQRSSPPTEQGLRVSGTGHPRPSSLQNARRRRRTDGWTAPRERPPRST